jgi:predicted nucleotidyltransferase component of viral defense system
MPQYNKNYLGRKARELGFVRDTLEKVYRLVEILKFINDTDATGRFVALKGGTAINLALLDLPRLSVDLDFDFSQNLLRAEMLEVRERMVATINRYMKSQGYELSLKSKHTHSLDSMVYTFKNTAGNSDNIKFEVNYSQRSHVLTSRRCAISVHDLFEPFEAITLDPIEIYAGKIAALMSRAAARDLYDIYRMVKDDVIPEQHLPLLKSAAIFYVSFADDERDWDFDFKKVSQISQRRIRTELLPVLRTGDSFELNLAINTVMDFLSEHIGETNNVKDYLEAFQNGMFRPELLFDDTEILGRIMNHPMVAWRLRAR